MPYEQLSFEDGAVGRIRSIYMTVNNYLQTSMALHGRVVESASVYALSRLEEVESLIATFPESAEVQRWGTKYKEFLQHRDLYDPTVD